MTISLIAAMSENRVIGRDGTIPWRLPDDLRFFMRTTMGHPLIMGRRTCETLDAPLPGRRMIVLSRRHGWRPAWDGKAVEVVPSLDAALELVAGEGEIYVAGTGVACMAMREGGERNYARVLERLQPYKDRVETHEKNVEALKRELANTSR